MMTRTEISNNDDVIDSRDVIARIDELVADEDRDEDETAELETLKVLADEGSDSAPDWSYGEALIRDSYFADYARELAEDIAPSADVREVMGQWPYRHIDWDAAADELQSDYTTVNFDGVDYWIRSA